MLKMNKKIKRILHFLTVACEALMLFGCSNILEIKQYTSMSKIENFFSVKSTNYAYYYEIKGAASVWSRRFHDNDNYIAKTLSDNLPSEISYEAYKKISNLNKGADDEDYSYLIIKSDAAPKAELKLFDESDLISIEISDNKKLNSQGTFRYYMADENTSKLILNFAIAKAEDENPTPPEEVSLF